MTEPIKSAFSPMKPAAMAPPAPAPMSSEGSKTSIKELEPLTIVPIELQIRITHNVEKSNIGYAFLSQRPRPETRTIAGCLNRNNPISDRALRTGDARLVSFLWGCIVAELLISRRGRDEAVSACFDHVMAKLQPAGPYVTAIASALVTRLAIPFKNAGGIYGPTAPRESAHVSIAELLVPMSRSIAGKP